MFTTKPNSKFFNFSIIIFNIVVCYKLRFINRYVPGAGGRVETDIKSCFLNSDKHSFVDEKEYICTHFIADTDVFKPQLPHSRQSQT